MTESDSKRYLEEGVRATDKCDFGLAMDLYRKSIEAHPSPAPYINRAWIFSRRIRHHEALQELLTAERVDKRRDGRFRDEISRQLVVAEALTENYRNGMRETLLAQLNEQGPGGIAEYILDVSIDDGDFWIEGYFFFHLDAIRKFNGFNDHPEAKQFFGVYSYAYVENKVGEQDVRSLISVVIAVEKLLCVFSEKNMTYVRRNILYRLHVLLMDRDYGPLWQSFASDCPGITREASDFISGSV